MKYIKVIILWLGEFEFKKMHSKKNEYNNFPQTI